MAIGPIVEAWKKAGVELGIEVLAPYILPLDNGKMLEYEVFLPQFGGQDGALLTTLDDTEKYKLAKENGKYCSQLNVDTYGTFDRKIFIEALNDFGWFGGGVPPSWYTGESWGNAI